MEAWTRSSVQALVTAQEGIPGPDRESAKHRDFTEVKVSTCSGREDGQTLEVGHAKGFQGRAYILGRCTGDS